MGVSRPRQVDPAALTIRLQTEGPLTAQALAEAVGVDRSNISRALAGLDDSLVRLGTTRGMRYGLRRCVRAVGARFPIYRLDAAGRAHEWAELTALHPRAWRLTWADTSRMPAWAERIHDHAGLCEGFPFFLGDTRPQGYLGRALARQLSPALGLPADPRNWSDDDTLVYLQAEGDDLPGNLLVGDTPARRIAQRLLEPPSATAEPQRADRYVALAAQAATGAAPGSSIEGEQPKFTTLLANRDASAQPVIVKFTDSLETPTGRRWADLLVAEAHALAVLHAHGEAAAQPRVLDAGGRRFYEIPRFDRVGAHGRVGQVSLRAVYDACLDAPAASRWTDAAVHLARAGLIDAAAERSIRLRHAFGELIGNSDMHFGNLAFRLDDALPLQLAPAYDMLPMLWAPVTGTAAPAPIFSPPPPLPGERALWSEVAAWAQDFWQRVAADPRVSPDFAAHARAAATLVDRMRREFGA